MSKYHKTTKEEREIKRLSSLLKPIDFYDNPALDFSELMERIQDAFSYNSSYYCNGRWLIDQERDYEIGILVDSIDGYQVLRYIYADYTYGVKEDWHTADIEDDDEAWFDWWQEHVINEEIHGEVAQLWIAPNGKETFLSCQSRKDDYFFNPLPDIRTPMRKTKRIDNNEELFYNSVYCAGVIGDILPQLFLREQSSDPSLFSNGNTNFAHENLAEVKALFSPFGEYLYKCQPYLFGKLKDGYALNDYEKQVKIANRNHYVINDDNFTLWFDYIRMLAEWDRINVSRLSLQPHYVCPADLQREHDRLDDRLNAWRKKSDAERYEKQFLAHHAKYLDINFTNGHLNARSLNSPQEYIEEGEKMHHCVGGYYRRPESLIFAVEEIATSRKVATVEVNIKNLSIVQIAGICNMGNGKNHGLLPEWNEIFDMVTANMDTIKARKKSKKPNVKQLKKVA